MFAMSKWHFWTAKTIRNTRCQWQYKCITLFTLCYIVYTHCTIYTLYILHYEIIHSTFYNLHTFFISYSKFYILHWHTLTYIPYLIFYMHSTFYILHSNSTFYILFLISHILFTFRCSVILLLPNLWTKMLEYKMSLSWYLKKETIDLSYLIESLIRLWRKPSWGQ